ncbi:MAG: hypothetical protein R2708_22135 [Vicinamibacterales bacterium]
MDITPANRASAVAGSRVAATALRWTGYVLFFLMLVVPTTYQPIKGVLLATVLGGIAVGMLRRGRTGLHRHVVMLAAAFAALGLAYVLRGYVRGAPGALSTFNVYVTWPLVYTALAAGASRPEVLRGLVRTLVVAANAIALYSLIYVLWEAGYWPDALYYAIDQGQAIGFYGSYIEFNLYSITSLLFMTPFLVAALLVFPASGGPVSRRTLWLSLALNTVTVLLTGRRALLVLVPVAPVLALWLRSWLTADRKRESRRLVARALAGAITLGIVLVVAATSLGALSPGGFVEMVGTGFQFDTDPVAMLRRDQFNALVAGWLEHPILGSGHGAPAAVIRSAETPWSYELSYVALLYHTGLLGVTAYAAGALWIGYMSYLIARRGWSEAPSLVATLVGTASFMIANATNPYLQKYDYIWVIFLPVAFVNCYLVTWKHAPHDR